MGKKHKVINELEKEMMKLAKDEKFEEAYLIKKKIFALNHIQDIALVKAETKVYRDNKTIRIEAYDIAHLAGEDMVGAMTVIEGGEPKKSEYRKFKIKTLTKANDPAALAEILDRRLLHSEWVLPQIVVVDGSTAQKNVAEKILKKHHQTIPVVAVVKDDRHKASRLIGSKNILLLYKLDILFANDEAHRFAINFFRKTRRKRTLQ